VLSDNFVEPAIVPPGTGRLSVERHGAASVVRHAEATSPLKWLTPANHGRAAWVFASTYGGGLVGGDAIAYDVAIGIGAAAWVSTQASTKVYRSTRGTSTTVRGRVDAGGLLVLMPDPVVCFASSTYRQAQTFDLHADASFIVLDWMTSGRRARGERWAFDRYHASLVIGRAGRAICHDAVTLDAADGSLLDRFGRFDVLATLVLVGPATRDEGARLLDAASRWPVARRADLLMSAAPLGGDGVLVRLAGRTTEAVGQAVRSQLSFLPALLGDDPWGRKW
jgi:urease accessory protein